MSGLIPAGGGIERVPPPCRTSCRWFAQGVGAWRGAARVAVQPRLRPARVAVRCRCGSDTVPQRHPCVTRSTVLNTVGRRASSRRVCTSRQHLEIWSPGTSHMRLGKANAIPPAPSRAPRGAKARPWAVDAGRARPRRGRRMAERHSTRPMPAAAPAHGMLKPRPGAVVGGDALVAGARIFAATETGEPLRERRSRRNARVVGEKPL